MLPIAQETMADRWAQKGTQCLLRLVGCGHAEDRGDFVYMPWYGNCVTIDHCIIRYSVLSTSLSQYMTGGRVHWVRIDVRAGRQKGLPITRKIAQSEYQVVLGIWQAVAAGEMVAHKESS